MSSPDGRLTLRTEGEGLTLYYDQQQVLQIPKVGMEVPLSSPQKGAPLSSPQKGAPLSSPLGGKAGAQKASPMGESLVGARGLAGTLLLSDYTMLSGKRRHCVNEANEYVVPLSEQVRMVVRLYHDGLAFRYELSDLENVRPPRELTTYRIAEGTRRWMQQWTDSYEGFFPQDSTAKVKPVPSYSALSVSADGYNCRWGYPALVEAADSLFVLITESNIERRQSAACLYNDEVLELFRVVPDQNDVALNGQWHTPWRVHIVGTLATVVESTLVTDVAEPCQLADTSWIEPGVVSWIYWANNHGSNDIDIIRRYVDMAERLKLPYVLIDAEWDQMKDGHTIEEAIAYARERGVKPMIWYNSSVGWVDGAPTPKYRLNKAEDREREFAWCERLGVAGVKIDFFSGDSQMNMDYCLDLLECAARHHLLVNFHGATIPRGWQRTWPHLLSTEGVYGAEWYNNVPTFTQRAAAHNATLPFTRNVVGPMDYTPCAFSDSQHPHITTLAHELALTVLFESGLQHLADRPESYYAQPTAVQEFLSSLPASWDDTRLLAGYPGKYVVIARRKGDTWYVAGINGTDEVLALPPLLSKLKGGAPLSSPLGGKASAQKASPSGEDLVGASSTEGNLVGTLLFADKDGRWSVENASPVSCEPRGGFVWVLRGAGK